MPRKKYCEVGPFEDQTIYKHEIEVAGDVRLCSIRHQSHKEQLKEKKNAKHLGWLRLVCLVKRDEIWPHYFPCFFCECFLIPFLGSFLALFLKKKMLLATFVSKKWQQLYLSSFFSWYVWFFILGIIKHFF